MVEDLGHLLVHVFVCLFDVTAAQNAVRLF